MRTKPKGCLIRLRRAYGEPRRFFRRRQEICFGGPKHLLINCRSFGGALRKTVQSRPLMNKYASRFLQTKGPFKCDIDPFVINGIKGFLGRLSFRTDVAVAGEQTTSCLKDSPGGVRFFYGRPKIDRDKFRDLRLRK